MWGAVATGAAKTLPWLLGAGGAAGGVSSILDMPKKARRDMIQQGPDSVTGEYSVPFYLKPFVDEENTEGLDRDRASYLSDNDSRITQRTSRGVRAINPGETVSTYLASTQKDFDKIQRDGKIKDTVELAGVTYNLPQNVDSREQTRRQTDFNNSQVVWQNQESARQFDNNLASMRQQKADALELERDRLGLGRLEIQMNQDRYMYEAETRRQDAREKRTSNLVQALAGLGAAFAI